MTLLYQANSTTFMKDSKLLSLFRQFNSKEWRDFTLFCASPYFNKNENVQALLEHLRKLSLKEFPEKEIERKVIYLAIIPGKPYSDKALNHIMSQLFQLAERFLSIEAFEADGILPDYYLLSSYVHRKLEKPYQLASQRAGKKLADSPFRDDHYYFQEYLLEDIGDKQFQTRELREYDDHLEKASAAFDKFYYAQKLKYIVAKLGWEKIISRPFEKPMIEEVKKIVVKYDMLSVPQIKIYYQLLLMLSSQNAEQHYLEMKKNLESYLGLFPERELKNLYSFISNFCTEKIRQGDKKYTQELMDVYLKGLEEGFFLEDGLVSPWLFKNMVKLGIGLENYTQAEKFIMEYSDKLPEGKRKDAYYFNMADVFYAQQKYDEAIFYLNQVEFSDVHYSLGAKELLLRIYYTLGETEAFLSLVFSFRIYLKRNKLITTEVKSAYENFIRYIHLLHKSGDKKTKEFEQKIKSTKSLIGRNWLLQQVSSLKTD